MSDSSFKSTIGEVSHNFYASARRDRIGLLPPGRGAAILEFNCGSGATGALALREGRCEKWIGVELNAALAADALFALTDVHQGEIETIDLPYPKGTFDVIFLGDRLPHLAKPAATLARMVNLLKPGGWLYAHADGDPLPSWLGPKPASEMFRRAGLRTISVWGMTDPHRKRSLFRRRRFVRLEVRGRKR